MTERAWLARTLALVICVTATQPLRAQTAPPVDSPGVPSAARSLLLPGWGQLSRGQERGWAYLAAEALLWGLWVERRGAGADLRDAYRDVAWNEGRIQSGARVDGDWTYYENVSKWASSGLFDADPAGDGLQPETDPRTFNGSIWALARDIYLGGRPEAGPGDPGYTQAVAYYRDRAYDDRLLWDWSGRDDALRRFKDLIRRSDDRYREATTAVGFVLLNHLVSATDAYVSSAAGRAMRLRAVPPTPLRPWGFAIRVGAGR